MKSNTKKSAIKGIVFLTLLFIISISSACINIVHASSSDNYSEQIGVKKQRALNQFVESDNIGGGISYKRIYLNMKNNVSLSPGEIGYFTYTPESDFYFVVETYGSFDTKIQVSNTSSGTIIDDDSGTSLNAKVEFKGVQGKPIYIATKLYNSTISGNFSIQLRKQRVSMFAYDDSEGNSTIPDLNTPYNKLNPMFEVIKYENTSSSDALSTDDRDLAKINSEIMFFTGHGYKNSPTEKGFGVAFKTGGITTTTSINMDRTKVAMWAACYSANSTNSTNSSIAEYSVKKGAKAAVGFTESVTFSSSKTFTNRFFTKLSEGSTVKEAASYGASGLLWPWDNGKKYVIFGNESIRITDPTNSIITFNLKSINTNILTELNNDVFVVDIDQNSKRYYEQIDGVLTNSFVDITYDENNKIIDVKDYRKNLNQFSSINNAFMNHSISRTISIDGTIYQLDDELSRNIVYVSLNNVMTPVEIITASYIRNGLTIEETSCINLTNGQKLDYSEINSL